MSEFAMPSIFPFGNNDNDDDNARDALRIIRKATRHAARLRHGVEIVDNKRLRLKPKEHPFVGQNWNAMRPTQRWAFLRHVLQDLGYLDEEGNVKDKR